jgi:hypothetical protein
MSKNTIEDYFKGNNVAKEPEARFRYQRYKYLDRELVQTGLSPEDLPFENYNKETYLRYRRQSMNNHQLYYRKTKQLLAYLADINERNNKAIAAFQIDIESYKFELF